jgi:hypothetical protein
MTNNFKPFVPATALRINRLDGCLLSYDVPAMDDADRFVCNEDFSHFAPPMLRYSTYRKCTLFNVLQMEDASMRDVTNSSAFKSLPYHDEALM